MKKSVRFICFRIIHRSMSKDSDFNYWMTIAVSLVAFALGLIFISFREVAFFLFVYFIVIQLAAIQKILHDTAERKPQRRRF